MTTCRRFWAELMAGRDRLREKGVEPWQKY